MLHKQEENLGNGELCFPILYNSYSDADAGRQQPFDVIC